MEPYVEEPKEEQDEEEDIFCDICEVQMQSASSLIKHKKQKHEPKICPTHIKSQRYSTRTTQRSVVQLQRTPVSPAQRADIVKSQNVFYLFVNMHKY